MIILTEEDKHKIKQEKNIKVKKVELSTGTYYVKYIYEENIFKELLGKKIADIIGLECPNCYMIKDEHCLLSEAVQESKIFKYAYEFGKIYTLNDLQSALENERDKNGYYNNVEEIMNQIYLMHSVDILFSNIDRHEGNYGFSLHSNGTGILVIYDHDDILENLHLATRPVSFPESDGLDYARYTKEAELRYFLEQYPEAPEIIKQILPKFNPIIIKLIMEKIERETNHKFKCKKKLLKNYLKNYIMINKVILQENKQNKNKKI